MVAVPNIQKRARLQRATAPRPDKRAHCQIVNLNIRRGYTDRIEEGSGSSTLLSRGNRSRSSVKCSIRDSFMWSQMDCNSGALTTASVRCRGGWAHRLRLLRLKLVTSWFPLPSRFPLVGVPPVGRPPSAARTINLADNKQKNGNGQPQNAAGGRSVRLRRSGHVCADEIQH